MLRQATRSPAHGPGDHAPIQHLRPQGRRSGRVARRLEGEGNAVKVLSFGGGVQTVALAAMACLDNIERPDFAVFADTQWEKRATTEYLGWFIPWAKERGLRIITTSKGSIRADALNPYKQFASMPLWTETGFLVHKGKERGMLRRQCTNEYKIDPVNRVIRKEFGIGPRNKWRGNPCELWLGISLEEYAARGRDSM